MSPIVGSLSMIALPVFGVALLWAMHLIYMRRPTANLEPLQLTLQTTGWMMIAIGLLAPMVASCIGLCLIVFAAIVACMAFVQYRANERQALLWMLAVSAQRQLPLPAAARAFAADRSDGVGRSALTLAKLLEGGLSLPEALNASGNRLPTDAEITTRLEYATGGLGEGMIDAARHASQRERMWRPLFEKALYFLVLCVVTMGVMTFLMLKVVPSFEKIFSDFDTELPAMTHSVITSSNWFATWWPLFFPLFLILNILLIFAAIYYIGFLRWEPPPVRLLTRPFHRATVLLSLARATEAGRPLDQTLKLLGQWYPQWAIRAKLQKVWEQTQGGRHWCEALLDERLLRRSDAAVLKAAERVGNLPWAMREMAARNYRRLEAATSVLNNVVMPLVLLAYAMPIAFIVIGLFLPLVALIQNLA